MSTRPARCAASACFRSVRRSSPRAICARATPCRKSSRRSPTGRRPCSARAKHWVKTNPYPWGRGRQNTRNIRKGFDTFTALGPWIVTRDELPEPQDVRIEVELNGRPAMTAHTGDMICGLRDHIRFLSNVLTLRPGDLITTGTPAGVAKLAPGDKLRGRIDRIGEMTLNVESEAL